jgi:hypothetical protein
VISRQSARSSELPRRLASVARARVRLNPAIAVPLVLLALAMAWDWGRPGLYMDSINPEYLVRWILHKDDGTRLIMPGNMVFGRLPVFTGTVYHGSTQLYFSLPFFAVLGINLAAWRVVQFAAAAVIVVLVGRIVSVSAGGKRIGAAAGLLAAGGLVLDPGFALTLRTQAYSCIFPVGLLLGAVALLRVGRADEPSQRRRLLAGVLFGLSCFSYFIFILFGPAMLWIVWRSIKRRELGSRVRAYLVWAVGVVVGYLPFIVGVLLIARSLGGLHQAVHYMANMGDTLHVGPSQTGVGERFSATFSQTARTFNGSWVSLTFVGKFAGTVGVLRAALGAAVIVIGLAVSFSSRANPAARHALHVAVALLCSFWVGSLVFGNRLQGHHFAALIPLWYLAIGLAAAMIVERLVRLSRSGSPRPAQWAKPAIAAATVAALAIGALGLAQQASLHSQLRSTGGLNLYSQAITALGVHLEDEATGEAVITPDWGYTLPLEFLAGDKATVLFIPATAAVIRAQSCRHTRVAVVNSYPAALDLTSLAAKSQTTLGPVELWNQGNGTPLFQIAWFTRVAPC